MVPIPNILGNPEKLQVIPNSTQSPDGAKKGLFGGMGVAAVSWMGHRGEVKTISDEATGAKGVTFVP